MGIVPANTNLKKSLSSDLQAKFHQKMDPKMSHSIAGMTS
jgi:hypothetical protein